MQQANGEALLWSLVVGLVAALASFLLVPLAGRLGWALGFVDWPRQGEVQRKPMPRSGGYALLVAVWSGFIASLLLPHPALTRSPEDAYRVLGVMLGTLPIVPLALLDDGRRLGPLPQLAGQIVIAAVPVMFGVVIDSVALPGLGQVPLPRWFGVLLTLFWIVAMINAINLVDVMDGLAAGVSAIAATVLFLRSLLFAQYSIATLPLAVAGCCLGFLPRNFHPARIIMGSSGSVLLGYLLATSAILGGVKLGTTMIVLAVPILDMAWVIVRRLQRGRSPLRGGDREHLPQRLHALGLGQRPTALLLYAVSATFGLLALSLGAGPAAPPPAERLVVFAVVGLMVLALLVGVAVAQSRAGRGEGQETRNEGMPG